jgi:hypothetical protein
MAVEQVAYLYRMSVTLRREWYDAKNPQPNLIVRDGKLSIVRIQSSDAKPLALMQPDQNVPATKK